MKILEAIQKYILYIVVALLPVFILLFFVSPFIVPKVILLTSGVLLVLTLWIIKSIIKSEVSFSAGKFDIAVFLIALSYLLSAIIKTPNKFEAFFAPGMATFVIASVVAYFLINQLDKKGKHVVTLSLFTSGILLSLSVLFSQLGLFSKIPQLPDFIKDPLFNPMGGILPSAIYLVCLLPICANLILEQSDLVKRIFFSVASIVIIFGLAVSIYPMLPGKAQAPKLPSYKTSWEIAVESLKQSPIWGVGPGNYLTAFNLYRPVTYNSSDLWGIRYTTATNFYFTLVSEAGLIGLTALVIFLISIYKFFAKNPKNLKESSSILALLILLGLFPISPVLTFLLFTLLAIYSKSEENVKTFVVARIFPIASSLPLFVAILFTGFWGIKAVMAETTFKKALDAVNKNNAKASYDLMTKTISQNPNIDRYRASLAQIDMALASSLANKKDLTDNDKQTISQLIQQSINEGKATVSLNPQRSSNWEVLAQIYRNVMPFATGADQFAVQTYTQAVALDPTNPNLRIALGGVYYALGRYDEAIDAFKLAVLAKQDLPNSHYNLAVAYREKKEIDNAIAEMNIVLSLVNKDSADYTLAKNTLDELKKNKPVGSSENLTAPRPIGIPIIKPPIELPKDATPPASQ